jgi:molecular chaperone DnaJ
VTVPPGTQPGEILRLRGKGLPVYGQRYRGDLNLRIAVNLPEALTAEERELYERLREPRRPVLHPPHSSRSS